MKGEITGDICNRDGCQGVMEEVYDDRGCSCHIHPPCSHCVDMVYCCLVCDFETGGPNDAPSQEEILAQERAETIKRLIQSH